MLTAEAAAQGLRDFRSFRLPGELRAPWTSLAAGLLAGAVWALAGPGGRPQRVLGAAALAALAGSAPRLLRAIREGGRRSEAGAAAFVPIAREFGGRDTAVAALLVRAARDEALRRGDVCRAERDRLAFLSWDTLSRHVLVVGNTGSGKTTGVFNHLMLSSRVPWIYQDQKAELPLRALFPERPVWGLDTRGYRSRSGVWNPLREIRTEEDVETLAALLIPDRGDEYDWVIRGARFLFEGLMKARRFGSLQEIGELIEAESPEQIAHLLPGGTRSLLANARQRGYFLDALRETLHPFMSRRVRLVTEGRSTVSLEDFVARGGYVLANEDRNLRAAVTLFWGLLLNRLRNRNPGSDPLLLLLDEFGDAGRVPNMASALALYRSKNVGLVAGVQTHSLLKTVYKGEWEAVRDGFGTVLVMTAHLPSHMHETLSRELGRYAVPSLSWSWSTGGPSVSLGPPRSVELVPQDRWGEWGEARACLVRGQRPTWWIPFSLPLDVAPWVPEEEADFPARSRRSTLPGGALPVASRTAP